jgi:hypothetical protein
MIAHGAAPARAFAATICKPFSLSQKHWQQRASTSPATTTTMNAWRRPHHKSVRPNARQQPRRNLRKTGVFLLEDSRDNKEDSMAGQRQKDRHLSGPAPGPAAAHQAEDEQLAAPKTRGMISNAKQRRATLVIVRQKGRIWYTKREGRTSRIATFKEVRPSPVQPVVISATDALDLVLPLS